MTKKITKKFNHKQQLVQNTILATVFVLLLCCYLALGFSAGYRLIDNYNDIQSMEDNETISNAKSLKTVIHFNVGTNVILPFIIFAILGLTCGCGYLIKGMTEAYKKLK